MARGNGEGSIYHRKDGRWAAVVTVDGHRRSFYAASKAEANATLRKALLARDQGALLPDGRQTVAQYLTHWLSVVSPQLRPSVALRYEQLIRLHVLPTLGAKRLARLSARDLDALYAERRAAGLSATTVHHIHAVLHHALAQAVRWQVLAVNPADLAIKPRPAVEKRPVLSRDEAERLLNAARGHRLEALIVLAVTTGMRQGELLGLRWQSVDLERRLIEVVSSLARQRSGHALGAPKTPSSQRAVLLPRRAAAALERRRQTQREERLRAGPAWQETGLVFTRASDRWGHGGPLAATHIADDLLYPLLDQAGLPRIRFHDLRHTFATLALGRRVPLKAVSAAMGHSRIGVTADLYSHVSDELGSMVAEAVDDLFGE